MPSPSVTSPAKSGVVYVVACRDTRRGCRSFHCPRQAEVVVRFDHEANAEPGPDWFWCLGHWPKLRGLLHDRGHLLEYSAEALAVLARRE